MKNHTTAENLVLEVQRWGAAISWISCVLQMDLDTAKEHILKFMIVTDTLDNYFKNPLWLDEFGTYTKCHKASHGFFYVLKVSYTGGVRMSFVLVETKDKKDLYTFSEMDDLDTNVQMLVKNE